MDNLTHTLLGLAAGEAVARCTRARPEGIAAPERRTALLAMGMLGGNLPDADLLWSMTSVTGDRLTYLVEHRGYTHTLVGCVGLALLLFAGTLAVLRWRRQRICAADARVFALMAVLAVMLHLGMDALNEYGVHPFWPWDNHWYYGDTVFIVEPLFWLALAPLFGTLQTRAARLFLGVVLGLGCVVVLAFHQFHPAWWALPAMTALLLLVGRRLSPRVASLASVALAVGIVGGFTLAHAAAERRVGSLAMRLFPDARVLDIVMAPAAAHPLCWDVTLLQRQGDDYIARLGQLSLVPGATRPCARNLKLGGSAPLRLMNRPVTQGMSWTGEYTMGVAAIAALARSSCDTRRLSSFLRAPFAARSGQDWIIGDLRYDREPGLGFAEMRVDAGAERPCVGDSPWTPPRSDLGFGPPRNR